MNALFRGLTVAAVAAWALTLPSGDLAAQDSAALQRLRQAWQQAPRGSREELRLEDSIQAHVLDRLGPQVIELFKAYMRAPAGSDTEREADRAFSDSLEERRLSIDEGRQLAGLYLQFDPEFGGSSNGAGMPRDKVGEAADVGITLATTQEHAVAAGRLSILGTVENDSDSPIWIVDRYTVLLPPPEIWARGAGGSVSAFFPSIPAVSSDEFVRVDPQTSYRVMWTLDPRQSLISPRDTVGESLFEWLQFRPGSYPFSGIVHVWTEAPEVSGNGEARNLSASQVVSTTLDVQIALPIAILVVGGAVGGLVGYVMRLMARLQKRTKPARTWLASTLTNAAGMVGAALAAVVGTILISRIGSLESFISLSINDIWGAIAMGFLIERLGIGALVERATEPEGGGEQAEEEAAGAGAAAAT